MDVKCISTTTQREQINNILYRRKTMDVRCISTNTQMECYKRLVKNKFYAKPFEEAMKIPSNLYNTEILASRRIAFDGMSDYWEYTNLETGLTVLSELIRNIAPSVPDELKKENAQYFI